MKSLRKDETYELTQQMIGAIVICLEIYHSTVAIWRSSLSICVSLEWCHFQYKDYKNTQHPLVIWTDLEEWSYCVCPACPDELSFSCQSECHQTIYRGSLLCQLVRGHQGAGELPKPKNNTVTIRTPQISLIQTFFWIINIDRQDQIRVPVWEENLAVCKKHAV